jgi:hypothetical protein
MGVGPKLQKHGCCWDDHSRLAKTSADAVKEILEHQHQNYLI